MSFLGKLVRWYREQVALTTGDIKKYVSAEKRVKIAIVASPILTLVSYLVLYSFFEDPLLGIAIIVILATAPWLTMIDVVTSVHNFSKNIEEEMPFVVAMVAGVANTGTELIEALKFLIKTKVFKAFKILAERFWLLSETLGALDSLRLLSRMLKGRGRLFILEYVSTLASGTALQYLRDRAIDFVKTAEVEFEKSMTIRMMFVMTTSMLFALLPVILISITMLYTIEIAELRTSTETPTWLLAIPGIIAIVTVVMCTLMPSYPLASRVIIEKKTMSLYRLLFAIGATMLTLPVVLLLSTNNTSMFKDLASIVAVTSIIFGAPSFISIFRALNLNLNDIVESIANHVRVYRSMYLYRDEKLYDLTRKAVRPWLADYIKESTEFFKLIGDVDPNVLELFVLFIFEVQRIKRRTSIYMLIMLITTIVSPFLAVATLQLGETFRQTGLIIVMGYITTLSFAYIASKLATGGNISTLLPGIATLIYTFLIS